MKITILGAGIWGSALAIALSPRHEVMLWGRNDKIIQQASLTRQHQGFNLPSSITLSANLAQAVTHLNRQSDSLLIIATSIAGVRPLSQALSLFAIPNLVWLCKG